MNSLKSEPIIGINTKGIATLTTQGPRPVIIEYIDKAVGFYHVRDLETNAAYTIFRTSFRMNTEIPNKYKQHAFNRVAKHWAFALQNHPTPVSVDSSPVTPLSMMRLLREARIAKDLYGWQYPELDDALWKDIADDLTLTEGKGCVIIGLKSAKFAPKSEIGVQVPLHETEFKWSTEQELDAFCLLLDHKLIVPRPNFVIYNLTPKQIESLESRYEIGFVPSETNPNKQHIL